jgi:long-chain acyl-CoA synthetase
MASTILDRRSSAALGNIAYRELDNVNRHGSYTRLYFEGSAYTNVEELAFAGRLASVLAEHGVQPGDRVVVLLPNSPQLTAAFQATWTIGAVMVPIIPMWTAEEVLGVISNAEPTCVLTIPAVAARLPEACKALRVRPRLLVFGAADVPEAVDISDAVAAAVPLLTPIVRAGTDLALLLYTSGTTAAPRGAMITHGNLYAALANMTPVKADMPPGPMLHALPLSHSFGLLMVSLANGWGWTTVLMNQFDPTRALDVIERHRVAYMPVVPTMLVYLLNHPALGRYDLSSLRRVISGGAALPEEVRRKFEQAVHCVVEQGYGLTETFAVATAYREHEPYRTGSAGRPAPGVDICIRDESNNVMPANTCGEICVSGAHVMTGYWRDTAGSADVLQKGFVRTGDVGYLDSDGFVYITDRKKDLIIKGGENISPREIEEALHLHPAVAAAAVVGVPDPLFGENICAVLELKRGAELNRDDIRSHVTQHVGKFKTPADVLFWPELPRNSTGKIAKRTIREQLQNGQSASA